MTKLIFSNIHDNQLSKNTKTRVSDITIRDTFQTPGILINSQNRSNSAGIAVEPGVVQVDVTQAQIYFIF